MPCHLAVRLLALVSAVLLINPVANAADLVLKRVMLSTGGVGYFEYEAEVSADATLALDVPLDQGRRRSETPCRAGSVGEITLPGCAPLTQSFADLPFVAPRLIPKAIC
jgi:hypothetical protein